VFLTQSLSITYHRVGVVKFYTFYTSPPDGGEYSAQSSVRFTLWKKVVGTL